MTDYTTLNDKVTQVLKVTADGEFIWHKDADRLIEEGDYTGTPAMKHILKALRQALEQPSDIEAAVKKENEACAEIAYSMAYSEDEAEEIAKAIRARVK